MRDLIVTESPWGEDPMAHKKMPKRKPGVCIPWEEKKKELPPAKGDEALNKKSWEETDSLGYLYIWQVLLSF